MYYAFNIRRAYLCPFHKSQKIVSWDGDTTRVLFSYVWLPFILDKASSKRLDIVTYAGIYINVGKIRVCKIYVSVFNLGKTSLLYFMLTMKDVEMKMVAMLYIIYGNWIKYANRNFFPIFFLWHDFSSMLGTFHYHLNTVARFYAWLKLQT